MKPRFAALLRINRSLVALILFAMPVFADSGPRDVFLDDFDQGPSPLWGNEVGDWTTLGGVYFAQQPSNNPATRTFLPLQYRNVDLEVDVNALRDGGLFLRYNLDGDGVLLVLGGAGGGAHPPGGPGHDGLYWHTIVNENITGTFGSVNGLGILDQDVHLRVVVCGARYSVYLNDADIAATELVTDQFSSGRIGLYDYSVQSPQSFDNFVMVWTPASDGDMNCDTLVTVSDIGGFVLALTNPAQYAIDFPECNVLNADVNGDGTVSVGDIGAFVTLLTGC
ncbi:MAG: hypothetical protein AB7N71_00785 [Phycisphaerae bacterium]